MVSTGKTEVFVCDCGLGRSTGSGKQPYSVQRHNSYFIKVNHDIHWFLTFLGGHCYCENIIPDIFEQLQYCECLAEAITVKYNYTKSYLWLESAITQQYVTRTNGLEDRGLARVLKLMREIDKDSSL